VHAVHREHHAADRHLARDVHARPRSRGEDARPALADLVVPGKARAGGVHADDVFILGPHRHHALEVAALERLVERGLRVLRGREIAGTHSFAVSAKTISTDISRMHLKCPSGHSRSKHGLHSTLSQSTCERPAAGGVFSGLDEPKSATSGRPSAAATCIRPESLLTTISAPAMRSIASSSVVLPTRFIPPTPAAAAASLAEPSNTTG